MLQNLFEEKYKCKDEQIYLMMDAESNFQNTVILYYLDDGQSPKEQFNTM
jgi:hypothetical protein